MLEPMLHLVWLSLLQDPRAEATPPGEPSPAATWDLQAHAVERPVDHVSFRPGNGLHVASSDGDFVLNTWVRGQLRYDLRHDASVEPRVEHALELKRASLFFSGNLFGAHNRYFMQFVFAPRDLGLSDGVVRQSPVFDWFLTFDYLRDFTVQIGQYKPWHSRDFIAAWGDLSLVDRSMLESEFLLDRDLGITVQSQDLGGLGHLRYFAGVFTGEGRNAYRFSDAGLLYNARFEVLPFGVFDDYREGDLDRHATPKFALGTAYAFHDNAAQQRGTHGGAPADGGTTDFHTITHDLMFKWRGVAVLSEFFWRDGTRNAGSALDTAGVPIPPTEARNGLGYFTQLGYLIPRMPVEVAGRFGQIFAARSKPTSLADANELGAGLSWYIGGHPFKLQTDYFRYWQHDIQRGTDEFRMLLQVSI